MTVGVPARSDVERSLAGRLRVVAPILAPEAEVTLPTRDLLHELALAVKRTPSAPRAWLLGTAVAGAFPEPADVLDLLRRLELSEDGAVLVAVLGATVSVASVTSGSQRSLELIHGGVIVDVDFCAKHEHNTGIQRVVRETIPRWIDVGHRAELVAWSDDDGAFRRLTAVERDRVLHWNDRRHPVDDEADHGETMLVPWESHVFLPEVASLRLCARLAAIGGLSGNTVTMIGYDAIPLVSAESQSLAESERFARYLSIVKNAERVVGISESAAEEFRGFVASLAAQGLDGPDVQAVPLAVDVPPGARRPRHIDAGRPLILCVGSHEARKNQEAVITAGEALWREGVDFELVFVGAGSRRATVDFDARVSRLARRGFAIRSLRGLSDGELWDLYAHARLSVFVSLHEGFGLPVAESLALGVPVITSNYGALAEIAALGGCLTVDPRDDLEILNAMRRLLTDDDEIARLQAEAADVPSRDWDEYADELWLRGRLGDPVAPR